MLKCQTIGNLGADPELRYSASGQPFLRFNIASNFRVRTPEGEWTDKTEWLRVTLTGARAESIGMHLKKGSRVYVDGRLEARPWIDQQGTVRAGLEVVANEIQFMSPRTDQETDLAAIRQAYQAPAASGTPTRPVSQPQRMPAMAGALGPRPDQPRQPGLNEGELVDLPF